MVQVENLSVASDVAHSNGLGVAVMLLIVGVVLVVAGIMLVRRVERVGIVLGCSGFVVLIVLAMLGSFGVLV